MPLLTKQDLLTRKMRGEKVNVELELFDTMLTIDRELQAIPDMHTFYERFYPFKKETYDSAVCEGLQKSWKLTLMDLENFFRIICKRTRKRCSLVFYGPSNAGKSLLARALAEPYVVGNVARDSGMNVHWLENTFPANVVLWEEPIINNENKEDVKKLLGREPIDINSKYHKVFTNYYPAPVVQTTNVPWWLKYCDPAYTNRFLLFCFEGNIESQLPKTWVSSQDIYNYFFWLKLYWQEPNSHRLPDSDADITDE